MAPDQRHPPVEALDALAVLHALADPVRMRIVHQLAARGEQGWGELEVDVAKSTLSHHLRVLRSAGVTRTRQDGARCFVRLRDGDLEARFPGVLDSVLAATQAR